MYGYYGNYGNFSLICSMSTLRGEKQEVAIVAIVAVLATSRVNLPHGEAHRGFLSGCPTVSTTTEPPAALGAPPSPPRSPTALGCRPGCPTVSTTEPTALGAPPSPPPRSPPPWERTRTNLARPVSRSIRRHGCTARCTGRCTRLDKRIKHARFSPLSVGLTQQQSAWKGENERRNTY